MPNRILKESICTSDSIDNLSWFEEVLFYRLIVNCDDYGRFDGRPAIIKNRLFPLKEKLTISTVSNAINTLASAGLVVLYVFEGKPFLYLPTWNEHQTVRAKRSKYPAPDDSVKSSEIICKQMQADVPVIQSNTISESNSYSEDKKRFTPPTFDEVKAYCLERKNSVDPQRFVDYYSSNGWKVGKNAMKDWRAAIRTWERSGYDSPKKQEKRPYGANNVPRDDSKAMEQIRKLREKMNSA
jgi:hypothetical protein